MFEKLQNESQQLSHASKSLEYNNSQLIKDEDRLQEKIKISEQELLSYVNATKELREQKANLQAVVKRLELENDTLQRILTGTENGIEMTRKRKGLDANSMNEKRLKLEKDNLVAKNRELKVRLEEEARMRKEVSNRYQQYNEKVKEYTEKEKEIEEEKESLEKKIQKEEEQVKILESKENKMTAANRVRLNSLRTTKERILL